MRTIWGKAAVLAVGLLAVTPVSAMVYSVGAGDSAGLVAALDAAAQSNEADIVELERGFYLLQQRFADTRNGLPVLRGDLRIIGNGAEIRRYSQQDFRIFEVARGAHVRMDRLVFAEGSLGAALNYGTLDCRHCEFIDHTDRRNLAIVENFGKLSLQNSEVSFNSLVNAPRDAGTIVNFGTATIRTSRLQANNLSRRIESLALASALLNFGEAALDEVQISENVAGLEFSGFSSGSVINLGNGRAAMNKVVETDNLPVASTP